MYIPLISVHRNSGHLLHSGHRRSSCATGLQYNRLPDTAPYQRKDEVPHKPVPPRVCCRNTEDGSRSGECQQKAPTSCVDEVSHLMVTLSTDFYLSFTSLVGHQNLLDKAVFISTTFPEVVLLR